MRTFLQLCCLIAILCIKFCENEKNDIILGKALLLAFQQGVFYLSMIKIQKVLSLFVMSIVIHFFSVVEGRFYLKAIILLPINGTKNTNS